MGVSDHIAIRALRSMQGSHPVYSFFIPGSVLVEIADISRIHRDQKETLQGFQRKEIKRHVNGIVEYLNEGDVLFPNAITLALAPDVEFKQARGRSPAGTLNAGEIGTLSIPKREPGDRIAWIVDGQQRSIALAQSNNGDLPVPVVAFVSDDLEIQRAQFILVNKAKPLPNRLINELLPEVDVRLPRDLAVRKIPSEVCDLLNRDPDSPFVGLIKRVSSPENKSAVIQDSAVMDMIANSLKNPLGALSEYKGLGNESPNIDEMYKVLLLFWWQVRRVFPDAWGLPPTQSRLMHGAGIKAMGVLMDRVVPRAMIRANTAKVIEDDLRRIAPLCCWTSGEWRDIGLGWREVQNTPRHVKTLTDQLLRLEMDVDGV